MLHVLSWVHKQLWAICFVQLRLVCFIQLAKVIICCIASCCLATSILEQAGHMGTNVPCRLAGGLWLPVREAPHHIWSLPKSPCAGIGKSWSKSVDIFSWTSILDRGALIQRVFMLFLIHKLLACKAGPNHTMNEFWKHLVWSFTWLQRGQWPDRDADGKMYVRGTPEGDRTLTPLAGGWRAILWIIKADLEFFANALDLDSYSSHSICFLCPANTSTIPWTDFRKGRALKLSIIWKFAEWLLAAPRHPFFFAAWR